MGFLLPTALALIGLAIPIIIFYMLKLRRQPARVSSLMLWQQVIADRQANAPWQKLKRNLLLLLQLLILALLVMALARPYFTVEAEVQGNVVLLLDASASMQATDVAPNRFAIARETALEIINRLENDDTVTLISVEQTPRVLAAATTNRGLLAQTLNATQVTNGPANWPAALTLAAANAATLPDSTIAILSDGATANETLLDTLPTIPAPVQFIPIGEPANNQGIVAMSLRDGLDGPELFVRVLNTAPEPVSRLVDIDVEEQIFDARRLELPPQSEANFTITGLPLQARQIRVNLVGDDVLATDDTAWAIRRAAPMQILMIGPGNLFLERALALLPDVQLQRATPDQSLPQAAFDMLIFDRTVPDELPPGNLFFIAPPTSTNLFTVRGTFSQTRLTRRETDHPLLTFVELKNLHISQSQHLEPPPWMRPIVESTKGPLLMAGQSDGRRVVILAFDLLQSDWPLQIEFPIFMLNLTRWLVPGEILEEAAILRPGQSFYLPTTATANSFLIRQPDGEQITLTPAVTQTSSMAVNQTENLGIYHVYAQTGSGQSELLTEFAVNLLLAEESNLTPEQVDFAALSSQATDSTGVAQTLEGRWEWWWFLGLLGLGGLLTEWWVYWRGQVS